MSLCSSCDGRVWAGPDPHMSITCMHAACMLQRRRCHVCAVEICSVQFNAPCYLECGASGPDVGWLDATLTASREIVSTRCGDRRSCWRRLQALHGIVERQLSPSRRNISTDVTQSRASAVCWLGSCHNGETRCRFHYQIAYAYSRFLQSLSFTCLQPIVENFNMSMGENEFRCESSGVCLLRSGDLPDHLVARSSVLSDVVATGGDIELPFPNIWYKEWQAYYQDADATVAQALRVLQVSTAFSRPTWLPRERKPD